MTGYSTGVQFKLTIIIALCFFILILMVYFTFIKDTCFVSNEYINYSEPLPTTSSSTNKFNQIQIKNFNPTDLDLLILSLDYENNLSKEKSKDKININLKKNIDKLVETGIYIRDSDKSEINDQQSIEAFNKKIDEYSILYSILIKLLDSYHISNPHLISIKINQSA